MSEPIDFAARRAVRQHNDMLIARIQGVPASSMPDEEASADPNYPVEPHPSTLREGE